MENQNGKRKKLTLDGGFQTGRILSLGGEKNDPPSPP